MPSAWKQDQRWLRNWCHLLSSHNQCLAENVPQHPLCHWLYRVMQHGGMDGQPAHDGVCCCTVRRGCYCYFRIAFCNGTGNTAFFKLSTVDWSVGGCLIYEPKCIADGTAGNRRGIQYIWVDAADCFFALCHSPFGHGRKCRRFGLPLAMERACS